MAYDKLISGTPWHVEKYTRAEGDPRRHRSRCIYYDKVSKVCAKTVGKCYGTAHCKYYKEPKVPKTLKEPEKSDAVAIAANHVKGTKPELEKQAGTLFETKGTTASSTKEKKSDKPEFSVGDLIRHEKYGIGKITNINGMLASAIFTYSIVREFDLDYCKTKGIIVKYK